MLKIYFTDLNANPPTDFVVKEWGSRFEWDRNP